MESTSNGSVLNQVAESDEAKAVVRAVEGGLAEAGEWLSVAQEKATAMVRKYPVQAVLLGLGIGAVLAGLVRGPRRE
jgi:hypothetical protein